MNSMLQSSPPKLIPASPTPHHQSQPHAAISLLQISKTHQEFSQIHALLIKTALIQEKHAFGRLFLSVASSHPLHEPTSLSYACKLFESPDCPRNAFIYNSLIKSYSRNGNPMDAILIFARMIHEGDVDPDKFTYTFVCNACSKLSQVFIGKQVHARMVKNPSVVSTQSWNSLMDFYVKTGEESWRVRRILNGMRDPDVVSWNSMLGGFVKLGELDEARKLFDEMPYRDTVSWTAMLVGYANAGFLNEACQLFEEMPERNIVSWTAMINGYARSGQFEEALALFEQMQVLDVEIDKITLTTMLSACAGLGALDQGRWIHTYINRHGVEVDAHLRTALVDMYSKCGLIDLAYDIFRGSSSSDRKVFLWNAMLGGLAMHSYGKEALQLFSEMLVSGTKPNEITFICLLSACSHSRLVDQGLKIFSSMARDHEIEPSIEHYGSLVDLLSRAGLLNEAKRVIETMPMEADGNVRRAFLGACRLHGNVELGEQLGKTLLDLEPLDDGNYVLLSNIYAVDNKWADVVRLRRAMKERGVRKKPGFSSIELDGMVHLFIACDKSHPQSQEIYAVLDELVEQFYGDRDQP